MSLREQCIALYAEHHSTIKVAALLGCTSNTVCYHLERAGIPRNGRADYASRRLGGWSQKDRIDLIISALRANPRVSRSELAAHCGISPNSLNSVLQMARILAPDLPSRLLDARQHTRVHRLQAPDAHAEVAKALESALTWREAAAALGVTVGQVHFLKQFHRIAAEPLMLRARALDPAEVRRYAAMQLRELGWTLQAIGTALGVTRQRVDQMVGKGAASTVVNLVRSENA